MAESIDAVLDKLLTIPGPTTRDQMRLFMETVFKYKPDLSVEIGVFQGRGLCTLATAHKILGIGKVIGIDPYVPNPEPENGQAFGDEAMYQQCLKYIEELGLQDYAEIIRQSSDDVIPPPRISILRVDGKHGYQSMIDVIRFGDAMVPGGALFLDDDAWAGAEGATDWLRAHYWIRRQGMDTGSVWEKPI